MARMHTVKNPASPEVQRNILRGALLVAPAWRYDAKIIGRKKLEEFVIEYVKWHNTIRNEAIQDTDHVRA